MPTGTKLSKAALSEVTESLMYSTRKIGFTGYLTTRKRANPKCFSFLSTQAAILRAEEFFL